MLAMAELLDRGVPDEVGTADLPMVAAAELDHLAGRTERWVARRDDVPSALRARALLVAGRPDDARTALGEALSETLTPQCTAAAVWTASRVGEPDQLPVLAARLAELSDPFVFDDGVPIMPTAVLQGLLAAARGDLDAAASSLRLGVADGDRRAPVWGARARLELARVLASLRDDQPETAFDSGATGQDSPLAGIEVERAGALAAALVCFTAAGYRHLRANAEDLAAGRPAAGSPAHGAAGDVALPSYGVLLPGARWRVGFGVQPSVPLAPSLGLRVLHHLVEHRGRRVSVVELDRVASGDDPRPLLRADLSAPRAGRGVDQLRAELLDDRARSRVSKLLRRTVDRIEVCHPLAGRHLRAHVTTGWTCRYEAPDHVRWLSVA